MRSRNRLHRIEDRGTNPAMAIWRRCSGLSSRGIPFTYSSWMWEMKGPSRQSASTSITNGKSRRMGRPPSFSSREEDSPLIWKQKRELSVEDRVFLHRSFSLYPFVGQFYGSVFKLQYKNIIYKVPCLRIRILIKPMLKTMLAILKTHSKASSLLT